MTAATTSAPLDPASTPALGVPQASIECARELALELADGMAAQLHIIAIAFNSPYPSDHIARAAWRDMRKIGAAMSKVMAVFAVPPPDEKGDRVPDVKGRLQ